MSEKWKPYVGEYADDASSEDEDILGVRSDGYTRSEMQERSRKLGEIEKFEKERNLKVVRKGHHRGLMASVRPRHGEYVTMVYDGRRSVHRIGDGDVDDALKQMRRGERVELLDGKELELVSVHEERSLKATSPWKIDGYVRKRRIVCGSSPKRPKWGDRVKVRVLETRDPNHGRDLDEIEADLSRQEVREIVVGAGVEREGLETCLGAMKIDEVALVFAGGEYSQTETDVETGEWSAAVNLLEIHTQSVDEDGVRDLKKRAGVLFGSGRHRRAEALYSRALLDLETLFSKTSDQDSQRERVEDELVVPLLLNLALCARKRQCHHDEETLVTKALRLARAPTPEFKAKAYLRRAAARIDLGKWKDAEDDLRLAASNLQQTTDKNKAIGRDVRRQLDRLNAARKADRQADKESYGVKYQTSAIIREENDGGEEKRAQRRESALLYEKEIQERLKAQRPWEFDPEYHKITRAPRTPLEKSDAVLKEDNLKDQYKAFDREDEEYEKTKNMIRQNWVMNAMYDTNGTGRRGRQPKGGSSPYAA